MLKVKHEFDSFLALFTVGNIDADCRTVIHRFNPTDFSLKQDSVCLSAFFKCWGKGGDHEQGGGEEDGSALPIASPVLSL